MKTPADQQGSKQPGPAARRAARLVGITIAIVGLAEACLRTYEAASARRIGAASPIVPDTDTGFSLVPEFAGWGWDAEVRLDHWGLRNPAPPTEGATVILNLGDSTTFGVSVAAEDTYSAILERRLNQEPRAGRFNVVNAGVPGYSSREIRAQVERKKLLERVRPHIVTLYVGWNDHWLERVGEQRGNQKSILDQLKGAKAHLARHLHLINLTDMARVAAARAIQGFVVRRSREDETERLLRDAKQGILPAIDPERMNVPPTDFEANLNAIITSVRALDCQVILLIQPSAVEPRLAQLIKLQPLVSPVPFFFHERYQNLVRKVANTQQVTMIDLPRRFEKESDIGSFFVDPMHPNAKGHQLIAEELLHTIGGLLPNR